jgi:hypothetical protein
MAFLDDPSSRAPTTRDAPFEKWFVCVVVKLAAAFFPVVKGQFVVFAISQVLFSG